MSDDGKQTGSPRENHSAFNRRLADKIKDAIAQAGAQGRGEIVERLQLIQQAVHEEGALHQGRRESDKPQD